MIIMIIISSHICFNCQAPGAGFDQLGQTVVSVILIPMRLVWCIIEHNLSDCWNDEWLDHNTAVAVGPTGSDFAT